MKRVISLLLSVILVIAVLAMLPIAAIEDGSGETNAPIAINNALDFAAMSPSGNYYLNADISITASYGGSFSGTFDGKNHTINTTVPLFTVFSGTAKDLSITGTITDTSENNLGAFARQAAGATLTSISNAAAVTGNSEKLFTAGIVGNSPADSGTLTVTNCKNTGTITGYCIGGILGKLESPIEIKGCINTANIVGVDATGGIVAWAVKDFNIENCVNGSDTVNYTVSASTDATAGMVGYISSNAKGTIKNCTNHATITNTDSAVGGLAGRAGGGSNVTFIGCINKGIIQTGATSYAAGGIAGETGGSWSFSKCVNHASVTATANHAGGISGYAGGVSSADYCFNYGAITGYKMAAGILASAGNNKVTEGNYVVRYCGNEGTIIGETNTAGGIIAYAAGNANHTPIIEYCYNTGNVTSPQQVSGILGYCNNTTAIVIKNCYNTGVITGTGEVKSTALFFSNFADAITSGNIANNYYTAGCADFEKYDAATSIALTANITAADITSGKLAYLLNTGATEPVFYQTINTDSHPVQDNTKGIVYLVNNQYSNNANPDTGDDAFVLILALILSVSACTIVVLTFCISKKAKARFFN